ncbi:hypothetical protein BH23GEM7_BH23GEM7_21230 [soil metagenome]
MSWILVIFAFIFVLGPLAKAYADRMNRTLPPPGPPAQAEIGRLREEVDRLAAEVTRLSDEQSFMLRLLSPEARLRLERPDEASDPPPPRTETG